MKDLIKRILKEETEKRDLIVPYRLEDRPERYKRIIYKKIQDYIKNGSKGDLDLRKTPIDTLPSNLKTVGGSLNLYNTQISSLPPGLTVGGYLWLSNTQISSLPTGLTVGGDLDLGNSKISSLPPGLTVGGSLNLYNTQISSLPTGLTVDGYLDLRNTPISSLPSGLTVGGYLDLRNTPISEKYTKKQIKKMIEDSGGYLKGNIYICKLKF